jgi:hypothetical protein
MNRKIIFPMHKIKEKDSLSKHKTTNIKNKIIISSFRQNLLHKITMMSIKHQLIKDQIININSKNHIQKKICNRNQNLYKLRAILDKLETLQKFNKKMSLR